MGNPRLPVHRKLTLSSQALLADTLHIWLLAQQDGAALPRLKALAAKLPPHLGANAYDIARGMERLAAAKLIVMRHGTRSEARGHYIVRVARTGAVLRTEGCPLDLPT